MHVFGIFMCLLAFSLESEEKETSDRGVIEVDYMSDTRRVRMTKVRASGDVYCEQLESATETWTDNKFTVREGQMNKLVEMCSSKRTKIKYPGTVWCGPGNSASTYDDLGEEVETDMCCRDHDTCKPSIPPLRRRFGLFNLAIWTKSHCKCDRAFHKCLTNAATNTSENVGWWFFNFLNIECFERIQPLECVRYNGSNGNCIKERPVRGARKTWTFIDLNLTF